jgi:hypothetical protein
VRVQDASSLNQYASMDDVLPCQTI